MSILKMDEVTKVYEGKVTHRARVEHGTEQSPYALKQGMGPSGSGKTTLLNIISSIDTPTSGYVTINGLRPEEMTKNELALFRRRQLGFVFQDFNLMQMLTVEENMVLPLTLDGHSVGEMKKRLADISNKLDLNQILEKRPNEISGGQAQRTAIGRALIHQPTFILADEPTGNLDSKATRDVMELLTKVNNDQDTTIIMVTHDPIAASYCDRVVFIKDGAFFNEIYSDDRRQTFFQRILNVLSLLGGNVNDLSTIRLS